MPSESASAPSEATSDTPTEAPTSEILSEIPSESASAPSDAPSDTPTEAPTVDPLLAPFEALDFGGAEIVIALSQYVSSEIPRESYQYIQGPERQGADTVLNAVYERNLQVEDALGISPRYVLTNLGYADIATNIAMNNNMSAEDGPDLYIDQVYGLIRAQMAGHLMNVKTKDEKSHFDFGEDKTANKNGWYNAYMHGFNFASDEKMYLLAGDYFTDVARHMTLTAVNVTKFGELFTNGNANRPELGTGTDYLYNTVEAGEWTADQMIEWSELIHQDIGSVKGKADLGDRLGVLAYDGGPSAMSLLPSMDVSLYQVSKDGTQYSVAQSERAVHAVDAWQRAFRSTGVHLLKATEAANGYADLATVFIDGNVLFAPGIQLFQLETQEMKGMEDLKCVIPYPKLYESDPYFVFTHDNARVGGILKTTQHFEAVSAWVQAASVSSTKVLDEYYNVALKFKESGEFGSATMLDIVYDSICNPKWIVDSAILTVTNNAIDTDKAPTSHYRVTSDTTNMYVSKYNAQIEKMKSALSAYIATFNALK